MRRFVVVNFDRYNPPNKAVNAAIRDGGPLTWLRWQTNSHRDRDVLDMPPDQRFLWWVMCDLAGQQPRTPDGLRVVNITEDQLAREAHLPLSVTKQGIEHLWRRGRIRMTLDGGRRVSARTRAKVGGDAPPDGWREGGHVPTYVRTNERTRDDASKEALGTTRTDEVARLTRLLGDVSDPSVKATLERKLARLTALSA